MRIHIIDTSKTENGASFHEVEIDMNLGAFVIGVMGTGDIDARGKATGTLATDSENMCQVAVGDAQARDYLTVKTGFSYAVNKESTAETKVFVRYQVQSGFIQVIECDPCKEAIGFLA